MAIFCVHHPYGKYIIISGDGKCYLNFVMVPLNTTYFQLP